MRKIGLMGGTFNPIHITHLKIAEAAMKFADLDEVLFIPSGCSYLKNPAEIASSNDRLEMVKLAIEGYSKFNISKIELERSGNSYTYVTLQKLKLLYPEDTFYFIMGADNLFSIEYWLNPEIIFQNCIVLATVRDDKSSKELDNELEKLQEKFHAKIQVFPFEKSDISSTLIRNTLHEKKAIDKMVPQSVQHYIMEHHLYE